MKNTSKKFKKSKGISTDNYIGVLLEEINGKIDAMIEGQDAFRRSMEKRLDEHDANFKVILEHQFNTEDRLEKIEVGIKEIKDELEKIKGNRTNRDERIGFLEKRVKKMETELEKYKMLFKQSLKSNV